MKFLPVFFTMLVPFVACAATPLSLKIGRDTKRGLLSVQGNPCEKGMVWEYQINGGQWMKKFWEQPMAAGTHTVTGRLLSPASMQGKVQRTVLMPPARGIAPPPGRKACPELGLNFGYNFEKRQISVQGQPCEKGMVWEYQIDDGPWLPKLWETKVAPGQHRLSARFVTPGYVGGNISRVFNMPGNAPRQKSILYNETKAEANPVLAKSGSSMGLPAGVQIAAAPQALSRKLVPTPRLMMSSNETPNFNWNRIPDFQMPPDLITVWLGSGTQQEHLQLLNKGFTHVNDFDFCHGQNINVPYNRRTRMLYNNGVESSEGGKKFNKGMVPKGEELEQFINDIVTYADDACFFPDMMPAQIFWIDLETYAAVGQDSGAYEKAIAAAIERLTTLRGSQFPLDHKVLVTGRFSNDSWAHFTDLSDALCYFKFNFYVGGGFQWNSTWYSRYQKVWNTYGTWTNFTLRNIELSNTQGAAPSLNLWAPYHEDLQSASKDLPEFQRYYKIRPDISEGTPIWTFLAGAKGFGIWNVPGNREWKCSEEDAVRGLWRIAQHADIFTGTQRYVVPEISLDRGKTWFLPESNWKGKVMSLATDGINEGFNKDGSVNPPRLQDRVQVRGVISGNKVLIGAVDPWQINPRAVQEVWVRYEGFTDAFHLHGRETYLAKANHQFSSLSAR